MRLAAFAMAALCGATAPDVAPTGAFKDDFKVRLSPGWTWIREQPDAWRSGEAGLEILIRPGNMWGRSNNATNILLRSAPDPAIRPLEVSVTVSNQPSGQYEQVDLVWFYDESNMVKIGQELVDGTLCLVMGREENDKTKTLAKIPISGTTIELKFTVSGENIGGHYRAEGQAAWQEAARCTLPRKGEPMISLQAYQGPKDAAHWARFSSFRMITGGRPE